MNKTAAPHNSNTAARRQKAYNSSMKQAVIAQKDITRNMSNMKKSSHSQVILDEAAASVDIVAKVSDQRHSQLIENSN